MDLWIRSQDKRTLINTRRIDIDDKSIIVWDEGRYASEIYLGEYATKERALEVLDEIQSKIATLNFQNHFIGTDFNIIESNIYQMPEK